MFIATAALQCMCTLSTILQYYTSVDTSISRIITLKLLYQFLCNWQILYRLTIIIKHIPRVYCCLYTLAYTLLQHRINMLKRIFISSYSQLNKKSK